MSAERPPSALEQRLLELARQERPSPGAKERALERVLARQTAELTSEPEARQPAHGSAKLLLKNAAGMKWFALALSGGLAVGVLGISGKSAPEHDRSPTNASLGNAEHREAAAQPRAMAPTIASASASLGGSSAAAPAVAASPTVRAASRPSTAQLAAASPQPRTRPAHSAALTPRRATGEARAAGGLANEVRLLAIARDALRAGDPSRAQGALAEYARLEGSRELLPEASVLRVELLIAQGQRARALTLARGMLSKRATGALAERLKRLFVELRRE